MTVSFIVNVYKVKNLKNSAFRIKGDSRSIQMVWGNTHRIFSFRILPKAGMTALLLAHASQTFGRGLCRTESTRSCNRAERRLLENQN